MHFVDIANFVRLEVEENNGWTLEEFQRLRIETNEDFDLNEIETFDAVPGFLNHGSGLGFEKEVDIFVFTHDGKV